MKEEFGLKKEDVQKMSKDEWHDLRMKCFDIECSEIDAEGECSERGEVAADVASMLYKNVQI